ncbi:MAG: ATP synthase F0 subunit B [Chloroflexi bacterium]|nr:ATP synthase F0 subunit B [Chloroflexota bacterium]
MDILHLVDRLEELFNESRAIPLTRQVVVDEDRMLDLIDQMRVSIPEEVKKAQQILAQRDRIMAQAQEEASRTLDLAREKSDRLVERDAIVQAANTRADQIVTRARAEAENTRRESDVYIYDSLTQLKREMERILNQVTNGLHTLEVELAGEDEAAAPEMGDAPARPEEA